MDAVLALKSSISANRVGLAPPPDALRMRSPALGQAPAPQGDPGSARRVLEPWAFPGEVIPPGAWGAVRPGKRGGMRSEPPVQWRQRGSGLGKPLRILGRGQLQEAGAGGSSGDFHRR